MFVITPDGKLVNLNAVTWISVDWSLANTGFNDSLWAVSTNLGEVSKPMSKEDAEKLLQDIAEKLKAVPL